MDDLKFLQLLGSIVSKNKTEISGQFTKDQLQILFGILKGNPPVISVDLSDNQIGNTELKEIVAILKSNISIEKLNLANNQIGDESLQDIAKVFEKNHSLIQLDLSGNKIGDVGVKNLFDAAKGNCNIQIYGTNDEMIEDLNHRNKIAAQRLLDQLEEKRAGFLGQLAAGKNPNEFFYSDEECVEIYNELQPRFNRVKQTIKEYCKTFGDQQYYNEQIDQIYSKGKKIFEKTPTIRSVSLVDDLKIDSIVNNPQQQKGI